MGDVVGIEDARWRIGKLHQLPGCRRRGFRIQIHALNQIFVRQGNPQFLAGSAEAGDSAARHRRIFSIGECNLPVSHTIRIFHQFRHPAHVIGQDTAAIFKHTVNRHNGDAAVRQIHHGVLRIIHGGDDHSVTVTVTGVIHIADFLTAHVVTDEGNVVAQFLSAMLEAVENVGEEAVRQPLVGLILKKNAKIIRAAGFQHPCGRIWCITHLGSHFADSLFCLCADIRRAVQRLTDSGNGETALLCNHLYRHHNGLRGLNLSANARTCAF